MKKLVLMLVLLLALSARADVTFWALCNNEADIGTVRIGYEKDRIEFGGSLSYIDVQPYPDIWGVYGIYNFDVEDVNNPVNWGPEKLRARPYIGGQVLVNTRENEDSKRASLIAGFWVNEVIIFETQYLPGTLKEDGIGDEFAVAFGIKKAL